MTSSSCSHWWHAPIYIAISVILAIVAISAPSDQSNPKTQVPVPSKPNPHIEEHELSSKASRALRNSGFNFMATLLQISPELVLPPSQSTIFAIQDPTISNISLPPSLLKDLLKYHTSPSKITMEDLLNKPQNTCFPTLFQGKNLTLTKIIRKQRVVEINGVLISHPDIFIQGPYSIHGVLKPFSPINPNEIHLGLDQIRSPNICGSNSGLVSTNVTEPRKMVPWTRILSLLSSNGFIPFAIGLNSVLDKILKDPITLNSVTIFAPPEFSYVASSSSPLLEKVVRLHLLPERLTYQELVSLPKKASLKTLRPNVHLEVTVGSNVKEILSINGVEITAPDVLSSKGFVVHGISRPLETMKLSRPKVRSISG